MNLSNDQKLKVIRFTYWLGAIMDAFFAIDMTIIALFGISTPLLTEAFTNISFVNTGGLTYQYAMGIGGALMWGWTVLLIWSDRKPIERKGILIITLFPVIVGIFITNIVTILNGLVPLIDFLFRLVIQILLMVIFFVSYFFARDLEK